MIIKTKGYNIPIVTDLGTFTDGVKKEIGTVKEYKQLLNMVKNSGLCYGVFTLGDSLLKGYAICNPYPDESAIEIVITTYHGNIPQLIIGTYSLESNKTYMKFTQIIIEQST